jgi:hypothetical protein
VDPAGFDDRVGVEGVLFLAPAGEEVDHPPAAGEEGVGDQPLPPARRRERKSSIGWVE